MFLQNFLYFQKIRKLTFAQILTFITKFIQLNLSKLCKFFLIFSFTQTLGIFTALSTHNFYPKIRINIMWIISYIQRIDSLSFHLILQILYCLIFHIKISNLFRLINGFQKTCIDIEITYWNQTFITF